MAEVELELGESSVWDKPEYAQGLGKERSSLEAVVATIEKMESGIVDVAELLGLAQEESDEELFDAANKDLESLKTSLETLEFRRMFSGEMDEASAYLDIQAGSGGTEAQDWRRCCCECICAGARARALRLNLWRCPVVMLLALRVRRF